MKSATGCSDNLDDHNFCTLLLLVNQQFGMANCFVRKNVYPTFYAILFYSLFYFAAAYVCEDVFFELDGLHLCPADCTECNIFKSCISCSDSTSGSKCKALCQIDCSLILIQNATLLRGCSWLNGNTTCCIKCQYYKLCSNCLDFQETCTSCSDGMYGVRTGCDKQCGHCKPNSKGVANCDSNTGFCTTACEDGYFGQRCDRTCSTDCLESATNSVKCDKLSGNCTFGCIAGRFNDKCTGNCSKTCLKNVCDRHSGTCSEGCIPGWYGEKCQNSCSEKCGDRSCLRHSGHCDRGCVPGWFGDTCERVCSSSCSNNTCNQMSAYCDGGCLPGWYGDTCTDVCSSSCIKKTCDKMSGYCGIGCLPGFYGHKCDVMCNSPCISRTCDRFSGHCNNGCSSGYYGDTCENVCNAACLNNTCDQLSGRCNQGCVPGWYGLTCEETCSTFCSNRSCDQLSGSCKHGCIHGWYGNTCETSCSDKCFNRTCARDTGVCTKGCVYGYFGDFCENNCSETCTFHLCDCQTAQKERIETKDGVNEKTSNTNQLFAILSVTGILGGTITGLVLCACAIYFIRKAARGRRRGGVQCLRAETNASVLTSHELHVNLAVPSEPIYDEIRTSGDAQSQDEAHTYFDASFLQRPNSNTRDACSLQRLDSNALDACYLERSNPNTLDACSFHRQTTQSQNEKLVKYSGDHLSKNLDYDRNMLQDSCEVAWPTTHEQKVNSHIQHKCPGVGNDQRVSVVSSDENVEEFRPNIMKGDCYGYLHPTI